MKHIHTPEAPRERAEALLAFEPQRDLLSAQILKSMPRQEQPKEANPLPKEEFLQIATQKYLEQHPLQGTEAERQAVLASLARQTLALYTPAELRRAE